jgi:co-chaperonin GroES (HSP10)
MFKRLGFSRATILQASLMLPVAMIGMTNIGRAQATTAASATARQIGTVKAISGSTITLATDAGQAVTITVADTARILQLAPGSTDLKAAQVITLAGIAVGDRVLVTGKAGDNAGELTASRVILMKSTDIAQKRAQEQADWLKRGSGGLVTSIDPATGTVTVSEGAKKVQVKTSSTTIFRRYSGDSVKFEDAVPGTLSQIQNGDQLRVRGTKSDDGASVQAEEIVSGSFKNLAGTIATISAADGTITLKDLSTKRMMTVKLTPNSDMRRLPERAATMFAARAKGGAVANGGGTEAAPARPGAGGSGAPGAAGGPGGPGRSAGMDLSQMLARLPNETIADLHSGEAVMVVASQAEPGSASVTAVTLLSGVEPILAATPSGTPAMTLSPWSVGGSAPDGGAQ